MSYLQTGIRATVVLVIASTAYAQVALPPSCTVCLDTRCATVPLVGGPCTDGDVCCCCNTSAGLTCTCQTDSHCLATTGCKSED